MTDKNKPFDHEVLREHAMDEVLFALKNREHISDIETLLVIKNLLETVDRLQEMLQEVEGRQWR